MPNNHTPGTSLPTWRPDNLDSDGSESFGRQQGMFDELHEKGITGHGKIDFGLNSACTLSGK